MKIAMNKDLTEKGRKFGRKEWTASVLIILVGCFGALALHGLLGWPVNGCVYMTAPAVAVIGVFGFYEKDQMSMLEIILRKTAIRNKISYVSTELDAGLYKENMERMKDEKNR